MSPRLTHRPPVSSPDSPTTGADDAPPDDDAPEPSTIEAPASEPTLADVVVAAAALLLFIANAPGQYRGSPVLLGLVAFPLGAAGLVSLGVLVARGDRAARFAAAFLGWAAISMALSTEPRLAWNSGWGADRGWLYFAAYVGCWAIGRRRGHEGVSLVTKAFILGLICNVLIALAQATVPSNEGLITLYEGRAMGFPLNPVFLAAYMAGGAALAAKRVADAGTRWALWLLLLGACAGVGNMAGSRIGIAAIVVLPLVASWRGRRSALRTGAVAATVVVGLVLGALLIGTSGTSRASSADSAGSGIGSRTTIWKASIGAIGERPIFGWGPNHLRAATSPRVGVKVALAEGPDKSFADAHNVLIELAVATGLPGLALACAFAFYAVRRSRGPLAWYALGAGITWLLEPFSVATVPTVMLALGLSAVALDARPDPPPADRRVRTAGILVATVLALLAFSIAARQVYVDRLLADIRGATDQTAAARRADRANPGDPGVHTIYTKQLAQDAIVFPDRHLGPEALRAAREGVDIDPHSYLTWFDLGVALQRFSPGERPVRDLTARPAFYRSQQLNPWAISALRSLYAIDHSHGNDAAAARWRHRLCVLGECPQP